MKLAFCLFNYFPYGGLQRDFLRIARTCRDRGHEIHVFTMRWEGEPEPGLHLHLIKARGWQNHVRCYAFAKQVHVELQKEVYDLVIGFNKMPFLDLYYAADVCYQSRIKEQKNLFYKLLPRYRQWLALEKAVFAPEQKTKIMLIAARQEAEYKNCYNTQAERFYLLPPGIAKDRIAPINAEEIRQATRELYQLSSEHFFLLMIGSGFKTKGLDRAIRSIAALPVALRKRCHLKVIGQDKPDKFLQLARHLRVEEQLQFLGGRADVPHFLLAADFLLHPSYHENTGTVLLEALVAGLPVLTVEACGYAEHVRTAKAGKVVPAPFRQAEWNAVLESMLLSSERQHWRDNGIAYSKQTDLYSLTEKAADLIELTGKNREFISTR